MKIFDLENNKRVEKAGYNGLYKISAASWNSGLKIGFF